MTVELITGHAGSAHISSADDGWYNAGTVGTGKYVLNTGTQLAAEVQSANLVTIGVGDALFEGRHIRVSATENVAIDNGAQGINRNDIICIKYELDGGTGVESASIAVVKGTGSSSTPSDPTIPSGSILSGSTTAYMPLWRIPISGIAAGTPEKLYDSLTSLHDVTGETWDVSQIPNLPASKITSGSLAIARGGTNASTAAGALQNIMAGKTVLYNNADGTTGTVNLPQSAANFNHMRVYATSPYGDTSVDIVNPNGKEFTLCAVSTDNAGMTTMYFVQQRRTISGTSITVHDNGYAYFDSSGSSTVSATAYIKVIRVEAWNE